jgi:hypothetical protein
MENVITLEEVNYGGEILLKRIYDLLGEDHRNNVYDILDEGEEKIKKLGKSPKIKAVLDIRRETQVKIRDYLNQYFGYIPSMCVYKLRNI